MKNFLSIILFLVAVFNCTAQSAEMSMYKVAAELKAKDNYSINELKEIEILFAPYTLEQKSTLDSEQISQAAVLIPLLASRKIIQAKAGLNEKKEFCGKAAQFLKTFALSVNNLSSIEPPHMPTVPNAPKGVAYILGTDPEFIADPNYKKAIKEYLEASNKYNKDISSLSKMNQAKALYFPIIQQTIDAWTKAGLSAPTATLEGMK